MSLDMERLIPVNFATVEDLQRIPHVGPKVACAIITLRESHGNLTLDTLQTFLRVKFNAETLEMLDFTRNVGLPVLQMPHEQFDFEGGEEAGLEERQRPISPAPSVFKDPFEMKPRTSVKAEAVEERQPLIAEGWETVRQKFAPMPSMTEHKLPLPTDPSQTRQSLAPLDYKVLRPPKLAEELGQKSKKKEGKRSKSRHRGKGAKHKKRGHRDSSSSSLSPSRRSAKKEEKLRKLEKSRRYDKKTSHKKRVQLNSSSSSSSEESKYHKKGAKPKKKLVQDKHSSSFGSSSSSSDSDSNDEIRAKHLSHHGNLGKGPLLILQAQTQILMMRSVQSTGLIMENLRKGAQAPVKTLMMSIISVQSTILIIRGQRNGAEQHFCDCCQRISAMMVKPTGWHSSRSSLSMPLHANGLLRNV